MPFDSDPEGRSPEPNDIGRDRAERLAFLRLDDAARDRLRGLRGELVGHLPSAAAAFYAHVGEVPELLAMLGGSARIPAMTKLQAEHWGELFTARFDDAAFDRAARIGGAHARAGLEPRWYYGGYCLILEQLIAVLAARHRARPALVDDIAVVLRAAFLDMDLAMSAYRRSDEIERIRRETLALADMVDREAQLAVGEVSMQAERLSDGAERLIDISAELRETTTSVSDAIGSVASAVDTVAAAAHRLETSSREISEEVERASGITGRSAREAEDACRQVRALAASAEQINGVVRMVRDIAQQTKMLALNAAIEAARAGEAGRGFGVVAAEVKALARQTEDATSGVGTQVKAIVSATSDTAEHVNGIGRQMRDVSAITVGVEEATARQREATGEIARNVQATAAHAQGIAASTRGLLARAGTTEDTARSFRDMAERLSGAVGDLGRRLGTVMRASSAGTRRADPREPYTNPRKGGLTGGIPMRAHLWFDSGN